MTDQDSAQQRAAGFAKEHWLVPPAKPVTLLVAGSTQGAAVGRVICIGRNYAAHAREMGADPDRESPFWFFKPTSAVVAATADGAALIQYPKETNELHHEVELVALLGAGGSNLSVAQANTCIAAWAVGVDLTRRDVQAAAKDAGRPWDAAKGFDQAAPCGPLVPAATAGDMGQRDISLSVNGVLRQQGNTNQMIWSPAEFLATLSTTLQLRPGDLVFTGTPAGVGPMQPGDHITAAVAGLPELQLEVAAADQVAVDADRQPAPGGAC